MSNEEKIKGITPELISDIYDIVEKFGIIHEDDQTTDFNVVRSSPRSLGGLPEETENDIK